MLQSGKVNNGLNRYTQRQYRRQDGERTRHVSSLVRGKPASIHQLWASSITNGNNADGIPANEDGRSSIELNDTTVEEDNGEEAEAEAEAHLMDNSDTNVEDTKDTNEPGDDGTMPKQKRALDLIWCSSEVCRDEIRERVVGEQNYLEFEGPATGQVAYIWKDKRPETAAPSVLILVKRGDEEELLRVACNAVEQLTKAGVEVLLAPDVCAKLKHYFGLDDDSNISLFEAGPYPGFGGDHVDLDDEMMGGDRTQAHPDLICTLGGDGLLMHAGMMFPGPVPPILCIAGGSLGFLTPFSKDEMVEAILISLGVVQKEQALQEQGQAERPEKTQGDMLQRNLQPMYPEESTEHSPQLNLGTDGLVCISMRMRLDVKVINREGVVRARFNVLNEVVIDRGGSPYLAALECFCDDVHLTTVQADGVIFAT